MLTAFSLCISRQGEGLAGELFRVLQSNSNNAFGGRLMANASKILIAAALIASATSFASAQGQPTGTESPVAGGAGGGTATKAGAGGKMSAPAKQSLMPSPAAQSQQKDASIATSAAGSKQEK
jgi:hypothetical protein